MDGASIKQELASLAERYGAWTDHNVRLTHNLYTMGETRRSAKLQRVVQIVCDLARKPIEELRILDLACLEGGYAIEFARRGARTVGIEGREQNIEKARFAQRVLGLSNLELIRGDVRDLSIATHGTFDVVLCLGILYHLNAPDVFSFLEAISQVCTGLAVFDTYVALAPKQSYSHKGATYWGREFREHRLELTEQERLAKSWASLDNLRSVWLTKRTLINILNRQGFTSVFECYVPLELTKPRDRVTMVALKGRPARLMTNPTTIEHCGSEWPERLDNPPSHYQQGWANLSRAIVERLPRVPRQWLKQRLVSAGIIKPASWGSVQTLRRR
jgi:2-polyprenyl-3-methyl-5-hydroxy-6-metoxy-1,4-benzoquinol methylase